MILGLTLMGQAGTVMATINTGEDMSDKELIELQATRGALWEVCRTLIDGENANYRTQTINGVFIADYIGEMIERHSRIEAARLANGLSVNDTTEATQ